jgi:ubiquinone/menaquinone biosynthesis C-methylase UbiE
MRDFRIQAGINFIRLLGKKGYWSGWLFRYVWEWIRPTIPRKVEANKIFDLTDIGKTKNLILKLGKFNSGWFQRIFEPETKGVRSWEYGLLLSQLPSKLEGLKILDVGSGGSLMPDYLASLGASVTSLDLNQPMEKRYKVKAKNVRFVTGDMTKMVFKNESFDVVISISAIEHLESWPGTVKAISEMKRVLKRNGLIFITTDFYMSRQKKDNWVGSHNAIEGAYPWDRLKEMVKLLGINNFGVNREKFQLLSDEDRSNYRGRLFTTAAFLLKK